MTVLMPAALLSMVPVLFFSLNEGPRTFYLTLVVALLVTVLVEVPIVKQIEKWTVSTLPGNSYLLEQYPWGNHAAIRKQSAVSGTESAPPHIQHRCSKKDDPFKSLLRVEFAVAVQGLFRPHYVTCSEQQRIERTAQRYLRNVVRIITEMGLRVYKGSFP